MLRTIGGERNGVLVLGDAPTKEEVVNNLIFSNYANQAFLKKLLQARIPRKDMIFSVLSQQEGMLAMDEYFPKMTVKQKKCPSTVLESFNGRLPSSSGAELVAFVGQLLDKYTPKIIVPTTNLTLWLVAGLLLKKECSSVHTYRGSVFVVGENQLIIPTFDPNYVLKVSKDEWIQELDVKKIGRLYQQKNHSPPAQEITVADSMADVVGFFESLNTDSPLAADIETIKAQIDCIGFAQGNKGLCVPFFTHKGESIFNEETEIQIVQYLCQKMRQFRIIGQNWHYDAYVIKEQWGVLVVPWADTTVMQHCANAGIAKDLGFMSSVYVEWHNYWKEEIHSKDKTQEDRNRWLYNAKDCVATYAVAAALLPIIVEKKVEQTYEHEMRLWVPVFEMMWRGFRIDREYKERLSEALRRIKSRLLKGIQTVIGEDFSPQSIIDLKKFFLEEMGCLPIKSKTSIGPSFDDDTLPLYLVKRPELKPITTMISEYRSVSTTLEQVCSRTDPKDGRMKTSYNITGATTGRFSSSQRLCAFGKMGMNMQNVTDGRLKE